LLAATEINAIVDPVFGEFIGQQLSPALIDLIQARLNVVMPAIDAVRTRHTPYFWLSFVDDRRPVGDQFIGACIVQAWDDAGAIEVAWDPGCNPGGQVAFHGFDDQAPRSPEGYTNRLLNRADCAAVDTILAAERGVV
jgi:hypothetical protein